MACCGKMVLAGEGGLGELRMCSRGGAEGLRLRGHGSPLSVVLNLFQHPSSHADNAVSGF